MADNACVVTISSREVRLPKPENMADVVRNNEAIEHHYFSQRNMAFFESKIETELYVTPDGGYFVTSERAPYSSGRKYTVRSATLHGRIGTVGKFQQYTSREDAENYIREIIKGCEK